SSLPPFTKNQWYSVSMATEYPSSSNTALSSSGGTSASGGTRQGPAFRRGTLKTHARQVPAALFVHKRTVPYPLRAPLAASLPLVSPIGERDPASSSRRPKFRDPDRSSQNLPLSREPLPSG